MEVNEDSFLTLTGCRSCGASGITPVLSLGEVPLANAFVEAGALGSPEPRYPLTLAFCPDCSLVQLLETVPMRATFLDYPYYSSFSETLLDHASELARRLIEKHALTDAALVVELASNDGYLLRNYAAAGIPVLGVEPAREIARFAEREHGIRTIADFFDEKLARKLREEGLHATVVHAHNVLAHVPDLNGFVRGIETLLDVTGTAVVEVPYVREMIDRNEFDTIYHEHLCYFSLTALSALCSRHGLLVTDVERVPIHGGSLRLFLAKVGHAAAGPSVGALIDEEREWGVDGVSPYRDFATRAGDIMRAFRDLLSELKSQGSTIAAYGAAAKGTVLLNCSGVTADMIEYVVDRNPRKQERYMPGVHVPIYGPEKIMETPTDYVVILAWNIAQEIMGQLERYRRWGGRFILPVPRPTIV
jgi:hypothetical protein